MKKSGVLNPDILWVLGSLGHTDMLVISDAGLPIPEFVTRIDLALTKNIPRFLDVLRVILDEMKVEKAIVAKEMKEKSPHMYEEVKKLLGNIPMEEVTHEEFKEMVRNAKCVIRTGEFTPYANIILVAGVVF